MEYDVACIVHVDATGSVLLIEYCEILKLILSCKFVFTFAPIFGIFQASSHNQLLDACFILKISLKRRIFHVNFFLFFYALL